jgi:hypothetical protein
MGLAILLPNAIKSYNQEAISAIIFGSVALERASAAECPSGKRCPNRGGTVQERESDPDRFEVR